ncbi:MAG: hypothetical protein M3394_06070 [Actinomycetota bacterium]|nr:hypothetical protein [Actinomycetota bacterium]
MDQRQTKRRGHRPALLAASLAACAFGSVPALAQIPPAPEVTVPLPVTEGTEDSSPTSTTSTTTPTTTTAPSPSPSVPTTVAPAPPLGSSSVSSEPEEEPETSESTHGSSPEAPRRTAAAAHRPQARLTPGQESFDVAPAAAEQAPAIARLRQVTLPAARQFGFPLGLAALVLAFLAVQGRLDARDPKLAIAPLSVDDDLMPFS